MFTGNCHFFNHRKGAEGAEINISLKSETWDVRKKVKVASKGILQLQLQLQTKHCHLNTDHCALTTTLLGNDQMFLLPF